MADHILCITDAGGIPLLIRSKAGYKQLPFPVVGSLNGVHMFGLNRKVQLCSTTSHKHKIVWKRYTEGNVVLIAISSLEDKKERRKEWKYLSDGDMIQILDNVFYSLVLLTGIQDLQKSDKNSIDLKLKRNLRCCHHLVDSFLTSGDDEGEYFGIETQTIDLMITPQAAILQEHLEAFVDAANSQYGCLFKNGRVVCATKEWWSLTGQELSLIGRLIYTLKPSATSYDIPVFLPNSNPSSALRLLIFTLIGGIRVCVLCGPLPTLTYVQDSLVERFWVPGLKTLVMTSQSPVVPDVITSSLPTPLLGFLLINRREKFCVSMVTTAPTAPPSGDDVIMKQRRRRHAPTATMTSHEERMRVNRMLGNYRKLVEDDVITATGDHDDEQAGDDPDDVTSPHLTMTSHYRVTSEFSFYWLRRGNFQIFTIFLQEGNSQQQQIPVFALRGFTENLTNSLLSYF